MASRARKSRKADKSSPHIAAPQRVADTVALFNKFLVAIRKRNLNERSAFVLCRQLIAEKGPRDLQSALQKLPVAWADHAIASVYATHVPATMQKRYGAYFTPPHLVDHLVRRLNDCGLDLVRDRIRDPAAGGAAFLVPLARIKVQAWSRRRLSEEKIAERLKLHLVGREIQPTLAILANALLRRMLVREFGITSRTAGRLTVVKVGDSLDPAVSQKDKIDHEVGNPPYLRLRGNDKRLRRPIFPEVVSGRPNLYALFVRRALEEVPAHGLVGYVVPASFLGGPEFASFRKRVLQLAEVLVLDLVEKRRDLFLDAIQDACFVVLRRREFEQKAPVAGLAMSGVVHCDGTFAPGGSATIAVNGKPWRLPGKEKGSSFTLKDWGYRAVVGYLVANRQEDRLYDRKAKGRFPLIWAKAIRPDGRFDFQRGVSARGFAWVDAPAEADYIVRDACIALQRTSARGQKRRITAAPISRKFIRKHGGVIAENHVILLVPTSKKAATPSILATALNRSSAGAELDRVCGTASISVRLLEQIHLGPPPHQQSQPAHKKSLTKRQSARGREKRTA